MILRLLLFTLALFFVSCQETSKTILVKGTAQGAENGTRMVFQKINENTQPFDVDTIFIENGSFTFEIEKKDFPEIGLLTFENLNTNVIFFIEDKNLKATIFMDSIYSSKISGSKENDLFNAFTVEIKKFNERKQHNMLEFQEARKNMDNQTIVRLQTENAVLVNEEKLFKKDFLEKNNTTLLAVMLLNEMFTRQELTIEESKKLFAGINPKLENNAIVKQIKTKLEAAQIAQIGGMAPDFSGPTPDGSTLTLQEALGKVTLIDFWASWCRPCRQENPNVVNVYNQYKDLGFKIISISLDKPGDKERWLKAIADDKMDWQHISNLEYWSEPIARLYGVKAIPATYILDESGRIVAKDLRGPALGKKIGELLSEDLGAL
ncbi:MAG: peroxiredoxin [Flavobacteriaceae bacterium CG_4_8_14_3_um_filter_34_10]|nr:MAG: peroxiredoxin [Flavobacteriaceae bacterium CG_4_8_14_3_um_filter_34_10]